MPGAQFALALRGAMAAPVDDMAEELMEDRRTLRSGTRDDDGGGAASPLVLELQERSFSSFDSPPSREDGEGLPLWRTATVAFTSG